VSIEELLNRHPVTTLYSHWVNIVSDVDLVYAFEDLSEPRPEEMFMHRSWHHCPHYDMSHSLDLLF
jgi:hypothetical protein